MHDDPTMALPSAVVGQHGRLGESRMADLERREQQLRERKRRGTDQPRGIGAMSSHSILLNQVQLQAYEIVEGSHAQSLLILRRWNRRCLNDTTWWRARLSAEQVTHGEELRKLGEELRVAKEGKRDDMKLTSDEVHLMSDEDLEKVQKELEISLDRVKGEAKIRLHREKDRLRVERDQTLCLACADAEKCILTMPCNHICLCEGCGARCDKCPICMAPIETKVKVFL